MLLKNGQRVSKDEILVMKKAATFQLSTAYSRYDQKNKKKSVTKRFTTPTSYVVFDKKENQSVEYRYAEKEIPSFDSKGNQTNTYQPRKISFENGLILVPITKPELFTWFMNNPELGTKFILKDTSVAATKSIGDETLLFQAKAKIFGKDAMPKQALKDVLISTGHKNVEELSFDEIKFELNKMAQANPSHFITLCESKDMNMKVLIHTALKNKLLGFIDEKNHWTWGDNTSSKGNLIVAVPKGMDNPVPFFIEWLTQTDNSGVLTQLQVSVEKAVKPKKETAAA